MSKIKYKSIPLLPLDSLVIFPKMNASFPLYHKASFDAIHYAGEQKKFFLAYPMRNFSNTSEDDDFIDTICDDDILDGIGVLCEVKEIFDISTSGTKLHHAIVRGMFRCSIDSYSIGNSYSKNIIMCNVSTLDIDPIKPKRKEYEYVALMRHAINSYDSYLAIRPNDTASDILDDAIESETIDELCDYISAGIQVSMQEKVKLLNNLNVVDRIKKIISLLIKESEVALIQADIAKKTASAMSKNQRDYFLREQIKVIQTELGEKESAIADAEKFQKLLKKKNPPKEIYESIEKEISKLSRISLSSPESNITRNYIETVLGLPFNEYSNETFDLKSAENILNKHHYGLEKVKERILEFLAVRNYAPDKQSTILCFVGPPGIGKTSIVRSIAESINRNYVRLSLGGVRDESDIRGHRKTYVGAMAGRIIASMRKAKTVNPLILLDEIDKLGKSLNGDPSAALLEVLDPEQNNTFQDHYIDLPYDLSKVLFVCTANSLDTIPTPLLDRMEIIPLSSYTSLEKFHIAKDHLLKKQRKSHGLLAKNLKVNDTAINDMIDCYTKESGVRQLERVIAKLCRKTVVKILESEKDSYTISNKNLEDFLGVKKYKQDAKNDTAEVGVVRGLAWTSVGGTTLSIEVNTMLGEGKFKFTGNVGKVMEESAEVALSYIRSQGKRLDLADDFYKTNDIHIHIPEGATPKDGPSAGITMTTAILSAFTGAKIRSDVAMTGEITIRGKVLPIGGLKEKVLAAKKIGINHIIIPAENKGDLLEIDEEIRNGLDFTLAETIEDVLPVALGKGEHIWK